MFSEKTRTLQGEGSKEQVAKKHVLAFKHSKDKERYSKDSLCTHDQLKFPAIGVNNAMKIYRHLQQYVKENKITDLSRIAVPIDEGQFFDYALVDFCEEFKDYMNIYVALLDRNYLAEPFKFAGSDRNTGELIVRADHRVHLKAVCNYVERGKIEPCGAREAIYTQMINPVTKEPILTEIQGKGNKKSTVKVGGKEWYNPRCKLHYVHPPRSSMFSIEKIFSN